MKRILFAFALLALGPLAAAETETLEVEELPAYERIDSFSTLGGLSSFQAIDNDTLIVWTSPSRPYLIELAFPSVDLRFAHAIAIDATTNRVHSGFDSVRVRGMRYPIREIYKLSREEARQMGH